ncbi:MAG: RluA family pseudouridine synthase [Acidiferrobacterales bacterium]|nr:RluA family pseudouridine synthase [Acidiferrobacterales bacterium]
MSSSTVPKARVVEAGPADIGQRIDNFLLKTLKGVPRTRIYKALRKGEVRVNGSRKKPTYQIAAGDRIRVPPIRHRVSEDDVVIPGKLLDHVPVIFEDEHMMVVNKPSGLAVHGGSGMDYGLIEALRKLRPELAFIELVHRLDRETSGCLMLAKSRSALLALQQQLASERTVRKHYLALVMGNTPDSFRNGTPLKQTRNDEDHKRVVAFEDGQPALTLFQSRQQYEGAALLEADLKTGRMHQARVHACHAGFPIAGDRLYGDRSFNNDMRKLGLGRLFLHAERLRLNHPVSDKQQDFYAPMPVALELVLGKLTKSED